MSAYADCPRCGTQLIWARLPSGKRIPLNRDPDPHGLAAAVLAGIAAAAWLAIGLTPAPPP